MPRDETRPKQKREPGDEKGKEIPEGDECNKGRRTAGWMVHWWGAHPCLHATWLQVFLLVAFATAAGPRRQCPETKHDYCNYYTNTGSNDWRSRAVETNGVVGSPDSGGGGGG
jgi:hypothetical protein